MPFRRFFPEVFDSGNVLHMLGGAGKPCFGEKIRVLVWNMYKARNRGWKADFEHLIQDRDLVVLQESILHTNHDAIFQKPGRFEWVMAKSYRLQQAAATGVKTGSLVASSAQSFLASPDLEPLTRTPKMLLATTYPVEGSAHPLLVVNVHAINFVSSLKYARQIAQTAEAIDRHQGPVILAGDFNTWSAARYASLRLLAEAAGLTEVALTRKGRWHHMMRHLDHVFYRGLRVEKADVLLNILSSDHFPICVDFTIDSDQS